MSSNTNSTQFKKRVSGTAAGVAAIAVVTCITLLVVNSGVPTNVSTQELSLNAPSQSLRTEFFIEEHHLKSLFSFQKRSGINVHSVLSLFNNYMTKEDQQIITQVVNVVVKYAFDIIDSNDNSSVTKSEWESLFKALYPQDTDYFNKQFTVVNGGKDFKIDQFKTYLFNKLSENTPSVQFKTPKAVTEVAAGKLLVNDNNNYKKTYKFVFDLYDIDGDKIVTRLEYIKVARAFGVSLVKASEDASKIFTFAKDNKFSADGMNIKYNDYVKFAEAIQKPLQDQIKKQSKFMIQNQLKQQAFIKNVSGASSEVYQSMINTVFDQLEAFQSKESQLNAEQTKVVNHVLDTVLGYEFSIADANNDNVLTLVEYKRLIDSVFKKPADREHFYQDFNVVNGGKEFTRAQFINFYKNQDVSEYDDYKPHEHGNKIGKRIAKLILNNDRNYELTYNFLFDLFDYNNDKVVSPAEIKAMVSAFPLPESYASQLDQNLNTVFAQLKQMGVGNGSQVTEKEWVAFAKKIRPELIKQLQHSTFYFTVLIKPVF